jgi:hypothetical protein
MVQYFPVITGSLTVNGDIIVSGTSSMSASNAISSSLALDSQLLSGTGSVGFTTTGSFTATSSSLSSRTTQIESVYATTGSNSFRATQSITGSLTVTGQIIAQTLNVQQVTSSIVYSSGSNVFGCDINSRQVFTGSFYQTGSVAAFYSCVGIGTNSPSHLLHLNSSAPSILLESNCSTGPAYLRFNNTTRSNTNYIALGGTSNDLFFTVNGADRFFISGSGNIGIGTSTPNRHLSIQGPAESWIESITTQPTTQCWIFGQDGARKGFEVYDLNLSATRLFVAPTTGNVGISNVCPRSPLSFSNGTGDKIDFYNDGTARYSVQVNGGELRFYTCGTDRISLYAGNTVGLVNRSGKIAIASTSTDALFSVGDWCNRGGRLLTSNCAGWATDGVTPCMIIVSNTTSTCRAQAIGLALHNDSQTTSTFTPAIAFSRRSYSGIYNSAIAIIQAQATGCANDANWVAGDLVFSTNPINGYMGESMRLTSASKLLIGTSTAGYGLFGEQRVTINPTNDGITIGPLRQNYSAYTLQSDNNTGNRYAVYIANASSAEVGSMSFTSTAVSFNTTSDYRLKQDFKDFKGLDLISSIKTYDFEWKINGSRSYGVIAHELQEVIPHVVINEKDGEKLQSVDYSKLVPVLVKAIQEQQCTINTLKTCIGIA